MGAICHSYDKSQSYSLLTQLISALAQIQPDDDEPTQRHKLVELVRRSYKPALPGMEGLRRGRHGRHDQGEQRIEDAQALLGQVMGLSFTVPTTAYPLGINHLDQGLPPKLLGRVLLELLKGQSVSQPIILALEDLQSADEDSLMVLEQVIKSNQRMALLLLAVYRPSQWSHNWGHRTEANIRLEELPSSAAVTMLKNLLASSLPEEVQQSLLKQTGGNPLFIEEYVWFLQENGLLTSSGECPNLSDMPQLNKVEAVIQARIARLDEQARKVLHSAAIIGQRFELEVLYKVQEALHESLDEQEIITELSERRLIEEWEEGWEFDTEWHDSLFFYAFRHGLVHQIASQLFPESGKQTIHRLVAQALPLVYSDEEKVLSRLAHHYYHSRDRTGAIRYCLRAAKSDAQKWVNQGAILWYERALEKIRSFEKEAATEREEREGATPSQLMQWHVEALESQANVRAIVGATVRAIEGYAQALALSTASDIFPVTHLASLYHKMAQVYHDKGEYDLAQQAVDKGLEALGWLNCLEAGRLHVYTGVILWKLGRFPDGYASCTEGIAIIEATSSPAGIRDLAQAYNLRGILCRRLAESEQAIISGSLGICVQVRAASLSWT